MTDTPLLDEIRRLDAWALLGEIERLAAQARDERAALRAVVRARNLEQRVEAFLQENPDATANAVCREIKGTKQEVLHAVRAVRHRFAHESNHREAGAAA